MPYFKEVMNIENKRDRYIVEPGKEVQVQVLKGRRWKRALKNMKKEKTVK